MLNMLINQAELISKTKKPADKALKRLMHGFFNLSTSILRMLTCQM